MYIGTEMCQSGDCSCDVQPRLLQCIALGTFCRTYCRRGKTKQPDSSPWLHRPCPSLLWERTSTGCLCGLGSGTRCSCTLTRSSMDWLLSTFRTHWCQAQETRPCQLYDPLLPATLVAKQLLADRLFPSLCHSCGMNCLLTFVQISSIESFKTELITHRTISAGRVSRF